MRIAHALLAISLLAAAPPGAVEDWSTQDLRWLGEDAAASYQESRAVCARVIKAEPPATDRPTPTQAKALKGCDSEALYFGIGRPADPVQARLCAFTENDEEVGFFGGRALLMTIYANGRGAQRNLDVATHLACGVGFAPAESHGRVLHLRKLRPGETFSVCDDITSGYMGGICAGHEARKAGAKRDAKIAALAKAGGYAGASDWAAVRKNMEKYADAHSSGDIDLTGTLRGAFATAAEESVRDDFLMTIGAMASGKIAPASGATLAKADRELNRTYQALVKSLEPDPSPGSITREGMREAGRAWIAYRDSMLAFAAKRYPSVSRTSLAKMLTEQRIADLSAGY